MDLDSIRHDLVDRKHSEPTAPPPVATGDAGTSGQLERIEALLQALYDTLARRFPVQELADEPVAALPAAESAAVTAAASTKRSLSKRSSRRAAPNAEDRAEELAGRHGMPDPLSPKGKRRGEAWISRLPPASAEGTGSQPAPTHRRTESESGARINISSQTVENSADLTRPQRESVLSAGSPSVTAVAAVNAQAHAVSQVNSLAESRYSRDNHKTARSAEGLSEQAWTRIDQSASLGTGLGNSGQNTAEALPSSRLDSSLLFSASPQAVVASVKAGPRFHTARQDWHESFQEHWRAVVRHQELATAPRRRRASTDPLQNRAGQQFKDAGRQTMAHAYSAAVKTRAVPAAGGQLSSSLLQRTAVWTQVLSPFSVVNVPCCVI